MATIRWGDREVPLFVGPWHAASQIEGFRKTYRLRPGQSWFDAESTPNQYEHLAVVRDRPVPVGVAIAGELMRSGADWAYVTELFGNLVLLDADARCVEPDPRAAAVFDRLREANGGRLAGLPDVVGWLSGRLVLREAKVFGKDRLQPQQHAFADAARRSFGDDGVDLAVVEWGHPIPSEPLVPPAGV